MKRTFNISPVFKSKDLEVRSRTGFQRLSLLQADGAERDDGLQKDWAQAARACHCCAAQTRCTNKHRRAHTGEAGFAAAVRNIHCVINNFDCILISVDFFSYGG